ncbi:transporter substrate-binding domain-containing protein [Pseudoalteromonas mariniglutinosa]|uniref:transporter substrate-binding domain-containing protein n=1 Tax=Pseudoalteromonas mariniglutinosa TaxID=206042 RepID=UPI00384B95BA
MRFLVVFCLFFSPVSYSQTWQLVTEPFPPFLIDNVEQPGWLTEIVVAALATQNIQTELEYTSWVRAVKLAQKNKRTAVLGAYHTKQRANEFYYSRPLATTYTGLFKRQRDSIMFDGSMRSLQPYSISKGEGYAVSEEFENTPDLAVTTTKDLITSLRLLQNGRVDLVAGTKEVAKYWLQHSSELNAVAVVYLKPDLAFQHMHLIFHRSNAQAKANLVLFEQGLEQVLNNGKIEKILTNYHFSEQFIQQYTLFLSQQP